MAAAVRQHINIFTVQFYLAQDVYDWLCLIHCNGNSDAPVLCQACRAHAYLPAVHPIQVGGVEQLTTGAGRLIEGSSAAPGKV